jgi:hypothetical protein
MNDFKKPVSGIAKVIGGVAGVIFLVAPITTKHGFEIAGVALAVLVLCGGAHVWAKREDNKPENSN